MNYEGLQGLDAFMKRLLEARSSRAGLRGRNNMVMKGGKREGQTFS